jgi:hypothetical protein
MLYIFGLPRILVLLNYDTFIRKEENKSKPRMCLGTFPSEFGH